MRSACRQAPRYRCRPCTVTVRQTRGSAKRGLLRSTHPTCGVTAPCLRRMGRAQRNPSTRRQRPDKANMNMRPVIGVTLDSEQPGGYSKYPWYAIRQNYADAIVAAGGLPIALPHDATLAAEYLDRIDALVVT